MQPYAYIAKLRSFSFLEPSFNKMLGKLMGPGHGMQRLMRHELWEYNWIDWIGDSEQGRFLDQQSAVQKKAKVEYACL